MDEPGSRVLRVRRTDVDTDSFVLVNVTPQGSRALDLKLVGTDGDDVYIASSKSIKLSFISSSVSFYKLSLVLVASFFSVFGSCYDCHSVTPPSVHGLTLPSVQHNRISKLRAANYDGSVGEWETALRTTLLGDSSDQSDETSEALAALECVSTVAAGTTLNLVWRRNIKGITVRTLDATYTTKHPNTHSNVSAR